MVKRAIGPSVRIGREVAYRLDPEAVEDLGLVAESEARARAQAYANDCRATVWARDEFSDEPLYSVAPAD
jgi:hypothetical protein